MSHPLNQLGSTFAAQLSEIVSGGDAVATMPDNTFVTLCHPGIPMKAELFNFAANGLGSGETAEDERKLANDAYQWAQMVDFVPAVARRPAPGGRCLPAQRQRAP